jgi:hypothetical protein
MSASRREIVACSAARTDAKVTAWGWGAADLEQGDLRPRGRQERDEATQQGRSSGLRPLPARRFVFKKDEVERGVGTPSARKETGRVKPASHCGSLPNTAAVHDSTLETCCVQPARGSSSRNT